MAFGDREMDNYFWLDWGMVNGRFLTVFLSYLNYKALGKESDANVKKMIVLLNKKTVSHRETCLHLLGWVHRERGEVGRAVQCFTKSLEERPDFNAAHWHLCFLICGF